MKCVASAWVRNLCQDKEMGRVRKDQKSYNEKS